MSNNLTVITKPNLIDLYMLSIQNCVVLFLSKKISKNFKFMSIQSISLPQKLKTNPLVLPFFFIYPIIQQIQSHKSISSLKRRIT